MVNHSLGNTFYWKTSNLDTRSVIRSNLNDVCVCICVRWYTAGGGAGEGHEERQSKALDVSALKVHLCRKVRVSSGHTSMKCRGQWCDKMASRYASMHRNLSGFLVQKENGQSKHKNDAQKN